MLRVFGYLLFLFTTTESFAFGGGRGHRDPPATIGNHFEIGSTLSCTGSPSVSEAKRGIQPNELGVIVNADDPKSLPLAQFYISKHGIPAKNLFEVRGLGLSDSIDHNRFNQIRSQLLARLPAKIQGLALVFHKPYKVECMGITSAFALGFDGTLCGGGGSCKGPRDISYFNSDEFNPRTKLGIIPSMLVSAGTDEKTRELIDRGFESRASYPRGSAYYVSTTDHIRSVRKGQFDRLNRSWPDGSSKLGILFRDNSNGPGSQNYITGAMDMMVYQTGLVSVPQIETNRYLPGAVADHLTSFAGDLYNPRGQMSALRWLDQAEATGSYGTVTEPCNYTNKFPNAEVFLKHYYNGETLLEAYWKSVKAPKEGVFIGDPLARPWEAVKSTEDKRTRLKTTLQPNRNYEVTAKQSNGLWKSMGYFKSPAYQAVDFVFGCQYPQYKIEKR